MLTKTKNLKQKIQANNKSVNFPSRFCLERISNKFDYVESEKIYLKANVYDSSFDYDAIYKYDISNIHKYLMIKNNIKECSGLLSKLILLIMLILCYSVLVDL